MKIQQFKIYNESELSRISEGLQQKLVSLDQDWFSDNSLTLQVNNSSSGDEGVRLLDAFEHKSDSFYQKGDVLLLLSNRYKQHILAELLQSSVNSIDLSCPASQQVLSNFIKQLTGLIGINKNTSTEGEKGYFSCKPGSGCVFLKISKGQWFIECLLKASAVKDYLPVIENKNIASMAKVNPLALIAKETTHIYADLGVAELSVQQLQQLAIGDILQLGTSFTDKAKIYSDNGDCLFEGLLAKSAGRRAIRLERAG